MSSSSGIVSDSQGPLSTLTTSSASSPQGAAHSLSDAQLQVLRRFVGGTVGGFLQAATSHPLDTVKAHLQSGSHHRFLPCCRHLWKEEGLSGLFRGVQVPIFFGGFLNSILFSLNQFMRTVISTKPPSKDEKLSLSRIALAAQMATPLYVAALTPVDRIKIFLQLKENKAGCRKKPIGLLECSKLIYQEHSIHGFMKGYFPNLLVHLLGLPAYFLGYEVARNYLSHKISEDTAFGPLVLPMCSGIAAGFCFWLVSYPFDLIKTKMQSTHHHMRARDIFLMVYKKGFFSLYKGIGVTLVRSVPANASVWIGLEYTERIMAAHGY